MGFKAEERPRPAKKLFQGRPGVTALQTASLTNAHSNHNTDIN